MVCSGWQDSLFVRSAQTPVLSQRRTGQSRLAAKRRGHSGRVRALEWNAGDGGLVSVGAEGALYDWRLADLKRAREHVTKVWLVFARWYSATSSYLLWVELIERMMLLHIAHPPGIFQASVSAALLTPADCRAARDLFHEQTYLSSLTSALVESDIGLDQGGAYASLATGGGAGALFAFGSDRRLKAFEDSGDAGLKITAEVDVSCDLTALALPAGISVVYGPRLATIAAVMC